MNADNPHTGAQVLTENDRHTLHDLAAAVKDSTIGKFTGSLFVKEPPAHAAFEYGWCKTDHKDGKEIRTDFRTADYINDEPYAGRLRLMLNQLGLPFPEKKEVFRGTHHDLLFLNSHGVVVRIGPTDVQDLVNPGIIQPLGWIEDDVCKVNRGGRDIPFTVAIYPGIELIDDYRRDTHPDKPRIAGDLHKLMDATGANTSDVADYNCGIIRVFDDDGSEVAVKMLLDPDNEYNASYGEAKTKRDSYMHAQEESEKSSIGSAKLTKGEKLYNTLRDVFNAVRNVKYWERAQEVHQPLRNLFWEAFDDVKSQSDMPDADKRAAFWDKCASVTNKPVPVTLPVWRVEQKDGAEAQGNLTFVRDEIVVPHLVLYRPWTGKEADRITKPIEQTPELKAAIARAHEEELRRPPPPAEEKQKHNWLDGSFRGRSRSPISHDAQDAGEAQRVREERALKQFEERRKLEEGRAGLSGHFSHMASKQEMADKDGARPLESPHKNKIAKIAAHIGRKWLGFH